MLSEKAKKHNRINEISNKVHNLLLEELIILEELMQENSSYSHNYEKSYGKTKDVITCYWKSSLKHDLEKVKKALYLERELEKERRKRFFCIFGIKLWKKKCRHQ